LVAFIRKALFHPPGTQFVSTPKEEEEMVRSKGVKKVLSITEVQNIKDEQRDLQIALNEAEGAGTGTPAEEIDKSAIKNEIRRFDRILEEAAPGRVSSARKDSLATREKEMIEQFREGLPTRYEMDHPAKCPGAVRKHQKWSDKNKPLMNEWRNIQRTLRPGEERSIEQLRKDGSRSKYI